MNLRDKINRIKLEKNNISDSQLLLLEGINETSGFFYNNSKILYIVKNKGAEHDKINTEYLTLITDVYINTIENNPTFCPGNYDLLVFNGEIEGIHFDSFLELCITYSYSIRDISFSDFFDSILNLFEQVKETSYRNVVGSFGELSLMKFIFEKFHLDIAEYWHNNVGSTDKYDFSFKEFNVEVKTTSKEGKRFLLKHSQIFNGKKNYICVININQDNSGLSLSDLFDFFRANSPFKEDFDFMIKLEKERHRVSKVDFKNQKFSLTDLNVYLNEEIVKIEDIPQCIDSISYVYDFIGQQAYDFEGLIKNIISSISSRI